MQIDTDQEEKQRRVVLKHLVARYGLDRPFCVSEVVRDAELFYVETMERVFLDLYYAVLDATQNTGLRPISSLKLGRWFRRNSFVASEGKCIVRDNSLTTRTARWKVVDGQ